jgi:hypothetical protein
VDAFGVLNEVLRDYGALVTGFLDIRDDRVRQKVESEIEDSLRWPEPWLALNPTFKSGGTVSDFVDRGVLHPAAREIFRVRTDDDPLGREITFHRHQTAAKLQGNAQQAEPAAAHLTRNRTLPAAEFTGNVVPCP